MKCFKVIVPMLLIVLLSIVLVACVPDDPTPTPVDKDFKTNIVAAAFFTDFYQYSDASKYDGPYDRRTISSFSVGNFANQIVAHVEFININRDFSTLQYKVIINDSIHTIYYATPHELINRRSICERYLGINLFEGEFSGGSDKI